jgi:1,4-alpha-glucan branching enzyme
MPKMKEAPRSGVRIVRFKVRLPKADEVAISGDFNQWDPEGIPLHHNGTEDWYVALELPPGVYEYRLRVDGEWTDDPDSVRKVRNPFGSENSVLIVSP